MQEYQPAHNAVKVSHREELPFVLRLPHRIEDVTTWQLPAEFCKGRALYSEQGGAEFLAQDRSAVMQRSMAVPMSMAVGSRAVNDPSMSVVHDISTVANSRGTHKRRRKGHGDRKHPRGTCDAVCCVDSASDEQHFEAVGGTRAAYPTSNRSTNQSSSRRRKARS